VITIPAPMQAPEALRPPFTDPDWLYELKFDGYRCMAGIEADDGFKPDSTTSATSTPPRAWSCARRAAPTARPWFPEIVEALAALPGGPHVIDGEACVLGRTASPTSTACRSARAGGAGIPARRR
jgi:bifunctional non-homologous end joining protein LigD